MNLGLLCFLWALGLGVVVHFSQLVIHPCAKLIMQQVSGFLLFSSPRLLVCHAICGSNTREGEEWRQAGGAGVPGAVEKDLE